MGIEFETYLNKILENTNKYVEHEIRRAFKAGYDKGYLEAHESTGVLREPYSPEHCSSCGTIVSDPYSYSKFKYCPECGKRIVRGEKV